jgi:hypothetical protein
MFVPLLIGGLVVAGVATAKAAAQIPRGPFSKEERLPPYYNRQVQDSWRKSRAFAYFQRRQHQTGAPEGPPDMVDSTGMTRSQREAWNRSIERVRAFNRSRG